MLEIIINISLYFFCSVLLSFILFLLLYKAIRKSRKTRKNIIINYIESQANQWSEEYTTNKIYLYNDLFSPIKMNNTGIGNNGSDLIITDYTANAQWFFKM